MRIRISEYRARFTVILLLAVMSLVFTIAAYVRNLGTIISGAAVIASIIMVGLLFAYRRGGYWADIARYITVLVTTVLVCGVLTLDPETSNGVSAGFFIPAVLALIMIGWESVLITGFAVLVVLGIAIPAPNPYLEVGPLIIIVLIILSMAVARITMDTIRERAEISADMAQRAQKDAEREAALAREQATELEQQTREQQRLLELVTELETPVVTIAENVLLMPVIGALDKRRAEGITRRLLTEVSERRSKLVILDMAGLNNVDTATAQEIYRLISAVRLLGCKVTITSISSAVAIALTHLGIDMDSFNTARSPQEVLSSHITMSFMKN